MHSLMQIVQNVDVDAELRFQIPFDPFDGLGPGQLLFRDPRQEHPQIEVPGPLADDDDPLDIVLVQEFEIGLKGIGQKLRIEDGICRILQIQDQLFLARQLADIVEHSGTSRRDPPLGHGGQDADAPDLVLPIAGFDHLHGGESFRDLFVAQTQLVQKRDGRRLVVDIEGTVGDHREVERCGAQAHRQHTILAVDLQGADVRFRRSQAAVWAHRPADRIVAQDVILQLAVAIGADLHIIDQVAAFSRIARLVADPVIDAGVLGLEPVAQQIIRVEDQRGIIWQRLLDDIKNILRVRIAHQRIPHEVRHDHIFGMDVLVDTQGAALVHLQDAQLELRPVEEADALQECAGDARVHIGTVSVAQHLVPVLFQSIDDEIVRRRFPIGARDGHDGFRFSDMTQKQRVDLQSDIARQVGAVAAEDL